jgi:hypothetical protein
VNVADLEERGARIIERPWGPVIFTRAGRNTERWRFVVYDWLHAPEGSAWRASAQLAPGGAS